MQHEEGTFTGVGGTELYYQAWWRADRTPQAVLAIVHGIGEHSGRYRNIVQVLVPRGVAVYGLDNRGHGRSPGPRGHINSFSEFRGDVGAFLKHVGAQWPNVPLFLMGHSMGGLIVLDYALHEPDGLSGVISASPHLADPPVSPVLVMLSQIMSRVWPSLTLDIGLETDNLSRDTAVVEAYLSDPLVHSKASARLGTELSDTVMWVQDHASELTLPLLMTHGSADKLTNPEGSRRFYENASSPQKQRIVYTDGYHELHNDIHRERVIIDLAQWLEGQVQDITTRRRESQE